MEIWKDVRNYEGIYEVSNMGRLRRATDHRVLKPWRQRNGYIHAVLCNGKSKKHIHVHRLVADAFLEKPEGKDIVNHLNCNPSDNRASNLEWCTQSENVKYAYELGRATNAARKKIVCQETNREFYSSMEAASWINSEQFHNSHNLNTISRTIRRCANGEQGCKVSYGYHWYFK